MQRPQCRPFLDFLYLAKTIIFYTNKSFIQTNLFLSFLLVLWDFSQYSGQSTTKIWISEKLFPIYRYVMLVGIIRLGRSQNLKIKWMYRLILCIDGAYLPGGCEAILHKNMIHGLKVKEKQTQTSATKRTEKLVVKYNSTP